MSANPTRMDWAEASRSAPDPGLPLQEGNRVLESLARQEALRALLAFSELHEWIRNRNAAAQRSDWDLFQTERFVLDEVLQLICDRAQAITQAQGVMIALVERSQVVCRAAAGPLLVERGARLPLESEFLQDCLDSGRILRCDDCYIDARVELDLSRQLGACSTVIVPLRGRRERIGIIQAFAGTPFAFTDSHIRCFDLFGELILSALQPEDQDRRLNWLADVADEILKPKSALSQPTTTAADEVLTSTPALVVPVSTETIEIITPTPVPASQAATPAIPEKVEAPEVKAEPPLSGPESPQANVVRPAPEAKSVDLSAIEEQSAADKAIEPALSLVGSSSAELGSETAHAVPDPEPEPELYEFPVLEEEPKTPGAMPQEEIPAMPFLLGLETRRPVRPGLIVVMGLAAVVALFSAGVWWGMQHNHESRSTPVAALSNEAALPVPPSSTVASDHLLDPARPDSVAENASGTTKLATLPRVTGIRHWSSALASTVVIDMEDQVPYEVHRLMSPERIYFDLHDTALSPELEGKTIEIGDFPLTRVRVAQPLAGVTRVVLDTKDGSNFSVSMESSPYRLIVQLRGGERAAMRGNLDLPASGDHSRDKQAALSPLPAKGDDSRALAKAGRFRIVLDAGHGGWDLGTVGREGLLEKDLVLDVTQRLGRLLKNRLDAQVIFTRSNDAYLPLDERADLANQSQADLFVSVHANYSSSAAARGVETYYTNSYTPIESSESEKPENGAALPLTRAALSPGELHEKTQESHRLAASIQRSLYSTLAANSPGIRDRGTKESSFVVLTGTTMPAILTEISFVSSPTDERNLQSEAYRQQIAEAIYKGISGYEATAHHVKMAQAQTTAAQR